MKRSLEPLMSSNKDTWETPDWLFDKLNKEFEFTLDAAAKKFNTKLDNYLSPKDNALSLDWSVRSNGGNAWLNPPYGRKLSKWIEHSYFQSERITTVNLIPARTDTKYWWDFCIHGEVRFIKGRLRFLMDGAEVAGATFPSAIVIFGPKIVPCVKWWDIEKPKKRKL